jgi:predicted Rdx family selenoprotein
MYCRLCGWGLRAGWMAQELLATFAEEIGSVVLTPDASGGRFVMLRTNASGHVLALATNRK